ncbi:holo-ACP synthase, partial [Acinetobacter baumannii]|uniref:holo-ACP synthase n=1 Tax=Acinetobacter baumannii TaxID=470 RepID=UPI000AA4F5D2
GTGIDIVELARIRSILQRQEDAFLTRILTQGERARIPGASARRIEYIAGRYAAKEALSKALGTGIGGSFSFQ